MNKFNDYAFCIFVILGLVIAGIIVSCAIFSIINDIVDVHNKTREDSSFNKPLFVTMGIIVIVLTVVSLIFKSFTVLAVSNGIQCIFVLIMLYMIYKDNKKDK